MKRNHLDMKMASNHGKEHHASNFYMNVHDQVLNTFSHNIECNFHGGQTDVNKLLLVTYWVKQSVEGLIQQRKRSINDYL